MLLAFHLVFASLSLPAMLAAVLNEFLHFMDNKKVLPIISALSFIGLVLTGTLLIIFDHGKLLGACLEGLLYLAALSIPYIVYRRLAARQS